MPRAAGLQRHRCGKGKYMILRPLALEAAVTDGEFETVGGSAADHHRGAAVHQGERNGAAPEAHLRDRRRQRMPRRPHEVHVRCKLDAAGRRLRLDAVLLTISAATRAWVPDKTTTAVARQQRSRRSQLVASARSAPAPEHPTSLLPRR